MTYVVIILQKKDTILVVKLETLCALLTMYLLSSMVLSILTPSASRGSYVLSIPSGPKARGSRALPMS